MESTRPKSLLSRLVDVRQGEVLPMLASMLWIFLALTAYYIIKPLRSTVLQEQIGVDNKPIALVATTAFVGVFAYVYGKIVPRVARSRLIVVSFLIFIACLVTFSAVLPMGGRTTGYVFYVWVSTFNLMLVSQFWSLAADVWTKEEGGRLFGFIGVGGVAGGAMGAMVVSHYAKRLSTYQMLFLSAGVLFACLLLSLYILRFGETRRRVRQEAEAQGPPSEAGTAQNAIAMVLASPYLRLVAVMMLVLNLVNSNNEWIFDKMVERASMDDMALKEFYGQYFLFQNLIAAFIQFFVTARVQQRFGATVALFFEPTIGLFGGAIFLAVPVLSIIRWHKILENAADYSIQSNTRELLYLPVTKLEKYSAKAFNDTFVVRAGDALAAASIYGATKLLLPALGDAGLKVMIGIDIGLGAFWLFVASRIGKMHKERMGERAPEPAAARAAPA